MSVNIKVAIKVRPLIKREITQKLVSQWCVRENTIGPYDLGADPFQYGLYLEKKKFSLHP